MTAGQLQPPGESVPPGAQKSLDALDTFAATLSHDLREPLRGIHHYAGLLSESTAPAEVAAIGARIVRLAGWIQSLTDSLLHYASVGSERLDLEECDLSELVEEALDVVEIALKEKGVQIRNSSSGPKLVTHPPFLVEILCNLIGNAAKYADKAEPYVEIVAYQESDGALIVEVRDNGIGIHADDHERIFNVLERLPDAQKYGVGVGMGLSITRRLLDRLSGSVALESTLGHGSCFRLRLPRMHI